MVVTEEGILFFHSSRQNKIVVGIVKRGSGWEGVSRLILTGSLLPLCGHSAIFKMASKFVTRYLRKNLELRFRQ